MIFPSGLSSQSLILNPVWARTHKAAGIVISNFPDCSVAHSNPLPFTGGFASVRSDAPIPDVAYIDNLYIEFVLRHPGAHDGSSLQGPYTVGQRQTPCSVGAASFASCL
jgi:hypothetical protein